MELKSSHTVDMLLICI